jgi:hypothetical protein
MLFKGKGSVDNILNMLSRGAANIAESERKL